MPSEIVIKCSEVIKEKGWNIAFAESVTAGRMAAEFSMTENSGAILRGGIVCYEVFVKEQLLHVPRSIIDKFTPESAEVTQALAQQAAKILNSKITVAVTGLSTAGGSETKDKPVGTIFLHIITPIGNFNHREIFHGSPEAIILQVIDRAGTLILESLEIYS